MISKTLCVLVFPALLMGCASSGNSTAGQGAAPYSPTNSGHDSGPTQAGYFNTVNTEHTNQHGGSGAAVMGSSD